MIKRKKREVVIEFEGKVLETIPYSQLAEFIAGKDSKSEDIEATVRLEKKLKKDIRDQDLWDMCLRFINWNVCNTLACMNKLQQVKLRHSINQDLLNNWFRLFDEIKANDLLIQNK